MDARKMGTMVSCKPREFTDDDIMKIADTFIAFEYMANNIRKRARSKNRTRCYYAIFTGERMLSGV